MKAPYHIVIPARLASERLPGKPLIEIAGRPLIEHVFRRARAGSGRQAHPRDAPPSQSTDQTRPSSPRTSRAMFSRCVTTRDQR